MGTEAKVALITYFAKPVDGKPSYDKFRCKFQQTEERKDDPVSEPLSVVRFIRGFDSLDSRKLNIIFGI